MNIANASDITVEQCASLQNAFIKQSFKQYKQNNQPKIRKVLSQNKVSVATEAPALFRKESPRFILKQARIDTSNVPSAVLGDSIVYLDNVGTITFKKVINIDINRTVVEKEAFTSNHRIREPFHGGRIAERLVINYITCTNGGSWKFWVVCNFYI